MTLGSLTFYTHPGEKEIVLTLFRKKKYELTIFARQQW